MSEKLLLATSNKGKILEYRSLLHNLPYEVVTPVEQGIDIEVDALGGEPGPLSARYAGEDASDSERIAYLLSRLEGVPWEKRTGRFRCVIAIATPDGNTELCSGECPGLIAFAPRGEHGFGYDPVFYLPEPDKTMAELPLEVKNQISHRGKAARKAYQLLLERLKTK
ncbi:non-canonical purine NTP pyrophosphatase [Chloroflexota bacterium]